MDSPFFNSLKIFDCLQQYFSCTSHLFVREKLKHPQSVAVPGDISIHSIEEHIHFVLMKNILCA